MTQYLFCHGLPGAPTDLSLFGDAAGEMRALDYLGDAADPMANAYARFEASFADAPVHLLGFSLGAMVALHIAANRPSQVASVTLLAPAAPLHLGSFLPEMAGAPVFQAARGRPAGLRAMLKAQALMARVAPALMLKLLFSSTTPEERLWARRNKAALITGLRHTLGDKRDIYEAILRTYVSDWSAVLDKVTCPVTIWQGHADTWVPPAMSAALAEALPGDVDMRIVPETGHFGILSAFAEAQGATLSPPDRTRTHSR